MAQKAEHEARVQRALERAAAPVFKKVSREGASMGSIRQHSAILHDHSEYWRGTTLGGGGGGGARGGGGRRWAYYLLRYIYFPCKRDTK